MQDMDTVATAMAKFRQKHELPRDYAAANRFTVAIGFLSINLPNFQWRKRAIIAHDLHHIVTGHPCTMRGECLVASWEFGAGRLRHVGATAFCLPLVLLGLLLAPVKTWKSFKEGYNSSSLHNQTLDPSIWHMSVNELKAHLRRPERTSWRRIVAFATVVSGATVLFAMPVVATFWLVKLL
jgi:hypothetical protein